MAASISVYAQPTTISTDSSSSVPSVNKNIYKLIISGQENAIKKHFRTVSFEELIKSDSGAIVKAFKRINTNDKVTRTIWILEEVKTQDIEVRAYIYNDKIQVWRFIRVSIRLFHS